MKFHELTIENYGVYSTRQLDLGDGRLQLIYGPNEAGKSTLLQVIRELLFGFPHQSDFAFRQHSGKMAATVQASLSDGRRLSFRRQKGRSNTVSGEFIPSGEVVDEQTLDGLLDHAGSELYDHVFGFSLQELSSGEQSLQHANLNEALYGGGIGGLTGFQKVRAAVNAEHTNLFSARGRKPRINELLSKIRSKSRQLKECALRPADYEDRLTALDEQQQQQSDLQQQLADLRIRQHRLDRLAEASQLQTRLVVLRQQQNELPDCAHFPSNGSDRLKQVCEHLAEAERKNSTLQSELQRIQGQLAELSIVPELLEHAGQVTHLLEDVRQIADFEEALPQLKQQQDSLAQLLDSGLKDLNPDWSADRLESLRPAMTQRSALKTLADEFDALQQQQSQLKVRLPDVQRQITAAQRRLNDLPDLTRLPALDDLIQRSQDYASDSKRLSELQDELQQQQQRIERLAAELLRQTNSTTDAQDSQTDPVQWVVFRRVPRRETVDEFEKRTTSVDNEIKEAEQRLRKLSTELAEAEERLQQECLNAGVVTREQLLDVRHQRDALWQSIRSHFIQGQSVEPAPEPDELQRLTADADRMADDRQQNAETVARQEQLALLIGRLERQQQDAELQLQQHQSVRTQCEEEWQALWQPAEILPESPAAMKQWLQQRDELLQQCETAQQLATRMTSLQTSVEAFEAELQQTANSQSQPASAALTAVRHELDELKTARADHRRLSSELPDLEAGYEALTDEANACEAALAEWQQRWKSALNDCGLPDDWTPSVALEAVQQLERLQQSAVRIQELAEQRQHHEQSLDDFRTAVQQICQQAAPDLIDSAPLATIRSLDSSIRSTRSAQQEQDALTREQRLVKQQQTDTSEQITQLTAARTQLLADAKVSSEDEFYRLAADAQKYADLQQQIDQLQANLQTLLAVDNQTDLSDQLQSTSLDELKAQQQEVASEISTTDQRFKTSVESAAVLARELAEFEQEGRYQELTAEVESLHAELAAAVDQWAPLVLMEALMDKALRSFEENHQPAMVASVSDLFRRLTHDRYASIRRRIDGGQQLTVVDRDGQEKSPNELSTGTREQLYLAIRLAFVLHYCESHEPLPIVMDDVLVNFDRQRARETLAVLNELSDRVQILFLTCHDHMLDLGREVGLTDEPIYLTDHRPTERVEVAGTKSATKKKRKAAKRRPRKDREEADQPGLFTPPD